MKRDIDHLAYAARGCRGRRAWLAVEGGGGRGRGEPRVPIRTAGAGHGGGGDGELPPDPLSESEHPEGSQMESKIDT